MQEWINQAKQEHINQKDILTFDQYLEEVERYPDQLLRTSSRYILDMLNHFGRNERGGFNIFTTKHSNSNAVFGQVHAQNELAKNLKNFCDEGINNKFILLVGPNGSAKSSFVKKIMVGLEEYSKIEEGTNYTFSWVFPIDNYTKGSLGFSRASAQNGDVLDSFAGLEDSEISAILNSELKDHPILLIPKEYRQGVLEKILHDKNELLENIKKTHLFTGDISKRNKMVYEALLKNYKGDHQQVLKHIRVERYEISKRYSSSAVTIEPQIHVDAQMQQITMDKRLGSLPPSLQSLNLFQMNGQLVMANRGVLEFSDLLKRPLDTYKYLLQTLENAYLNINGILTELDILFIGTSNEIHLTAFKQHPDFNSFKGRFKIIKAPYLLCYKQELNIYLEQVKSIKKNHQFDPLTLEALCLFAVMTRLRSPMTKNYPDKKLAQIITKLNPLEKTLFISEDNQLPNELTTEEKQILSQHRDEVMDEFINENLYEGKFGISPRDLKNIIYDLGSENEHVSLIDIVEYLKKLITLKNEYEFLNMTTQGDYHHPVRFIDLITSHLLDIFDKQLRDSLGLVDNRSYEEYIKKYINHINAEIKGEKIKNDVTGKFDSADGFFISEFEKNIALKEDATKFRSHLISKLGAYSLDNPGQIISYCEVFPDLEKSLKESFRYEQRKLIQNMSKYMVYFEKSLVGDESSGNQYQAEIEKIEEVINQLHSKHEYSKKGALELIKFIIKERY